MLELREWIASNRLPQRPWLILGKGPTFARRDEFPLDEYHLFGLNDVVGTMRVDVAHMIDIDVVGKVADQLEDNCGVLLMPRRPHVDFQPTQRKLEDFFDEHPVLRRLHEANRLVWYNAETGDPVDNSPVIRVTQFSSEAAVDILGEAGATVVRTLGIDGGTDYSGEFSGLTPLGNRRTSFDVQFRYIEDIVRARGLDYDPLIEPIRVFVGTDDTQVVPTRVLEYSIRKHATKPVRFVPMVDVPTPTPKDPANRGRTGFSFSRFHIPRLANFRGRGIYLDADMQVFSDMAELVDWPLGERKMLCTRQDQVPKAWGDNSWFHPGRQMSVMVLDCERLRWDVEEIIGGMDAGRYDYQDLMFHMSILDEAEIGDDLPPEWNHLETHVPGETKLTHYTIVPTQPWKNDENPLREVWEAEFEEARRAGLILPSEIRRSAVKGDFKRELAGLPPESAANRVKNRARAAVEQGVLAADRRYGVLSKPAVQRLRRRVSKARGA